MDMIIRNEKRVKSNKKILGVSWEHKLKYAIQYKHTIK